MDKDNRSRIVTVKVNEVLADEYTKEVKKMDEKAKKLFKELDLEKDNKQLKAMAKAFATHAANLNKQAEELQQTLPDGIHIDFDDGLRGYSGIDPKGFSISVSREKKYVKGKWTYPDEPNFAVHSDIVSTLTELRNHPNERIQKVAREGFKLIVEDDEKLLEKFLGL